MKQKTLLILIGIMAAIFLLATAGKQNSQFGATIYADRYSTATNATTTANTGTSTLVLAAANGGRQDFELSNTGTANVTLCKALTCLNGAGIQINSGGGSYTNQQAQDNYNGPISVYAVATTTLGIIYSQ